MKKDSIPLESVIVREIMAALKRAGYLHWKTHGHAYQASGQPDLIVIGKSGRYIGLEAKRPRIGVLTDLQARTLNQINEAGGFACVVHSAEEAMVMVRLADDGRDWLEKFRGGKA